MSCPVAPEVPSNMRNGHVWALPSTIILPLDTPNSRPGSMAFLVCLEDSTWSDRKMKAGLLFFFFVKSSAFRVPRSLLSAQSLVQLWWVQLLLEEKPHVTSCFPSLKGSTQMGMRNSHVYRITVNALLHTSWGGCRVTVMWMYFPQSELAVHFWRAADAATSQGPSETSLEGLLLPNTGASCEAK